MFNLQGSEIIIVLLLALVVLGPEKLPDAMRKMGQAYAELKKMSSGFQSEFRAVLDEPMREVRDTANVLRDSADFTKLQSGERDEKPKSAEMAPADSNDVPTDDVPTFEPDPVADDGGGPELAADSKPSPFSGESSAAPRPERAPIPTPPLPFTGMVASEAAAGEGDDDDGGSDVRDAGGSQAAPDSSESAIPAKPAEPAPDASAGTGTDDAGDEPDVDR